MKRPSLFGILAFLIVAVIGTAPFARGATTALLQNVPEAKNYTLVLQKDIPVMSGGWNTAGNLVYDTNNTASITGFDRIAYYWELTRPGGQVDYVFVSCDAFTTVPGRIGIPTAASGALFRQFLTNMNVVSNVTGIVNGTNIQTGNIEFWSSDPLATNSLPVPGASNSVFDFGDTNSTGSGSGSMQIHNYGASQTLFAYNAWGTMRTSELGLGNAPAANLDWSTNTANISVYTTRVLQVLVREIPTTTANHTLASGTDGYDGANLLTNGSFETGTATRAVNALNGGDTTTISGWQVVGAPAEILHYTNGFWQNLDGARSVDFGTSSTASLRQTFATAPGLDYQVSFGMSSDSQRSPSSKVLRLSVTDPLNGNASLGQQTFSYMNTSSSNFARMEWQIKTLNFTATSTSTTIAFDGPAPVVTPLSGAVLDNVIVSKKLATTNRNTLTVAAPGVLANDVGSDLTASRVVTQLNGSGTLTGTSTQGAAVTINPDGSFTYNPSGSVALQALAVGASMTDTFTYTVSSGPVTGGTGMAFTNAPEAAGFSLIYQLAIPTTADYNNTTTPTNPAYSVNRSASYGYTFDRIAYYLELNTNYAYVSMNAFTTLLGRIGVPNINSGASFQQFVSNMNVISNVATLTTRGTGITTGSIEFWPNNYGVNAPAIFPNASSTYHDVGDTMATPVAGYGCMQVHNYDIDGAGGSTAGEVILAYNHWSSNGTAELGIGNNPNFMAANQNLDYTFSNNGGSFTTKNLQVLVRPVPLTNTVTVTITVTNIGLTVGDVDVMETSAGLTTVNFPVTLSNPSYHPITARLDTADGTATVAAGDYVAVSNGLVTIPAGVTSATFPVSVNGDINFEFDETFNVTLSNPATATITDGAGMATLRNDDSPPTISALNFQQFEGNAGPNTFNIVLTLSATTTVPVTVQYSTSNDTAITGVDYTAVTNGVVTIPAGALTGVAPVTVNGDLSQEPNESFNITLNTPTGATILLASAVVTIRDDDAPVLIDDAATTAEDVPAVINVLSNDTGVNALPLTITTSAGPASGTVTVNADNTITYTPAADVFGTDGFSYTVVDALGRTGTGNVAVTIQSVNDVPIAASQSVSIGLNLPVTLTLTATEPINENTILDFRLVTSPLHGTLGAIVNATPFSATVTYTPTAGYSGPDSFSFRASDGQSNSLPAQVSINVTPAPTFVSVPIVNPNPALVGQTVTGIAVAGASSVTWDFGDGTQGSGSVVTHVYPQAGVYTITVSATSTQGIKSTNTLQIFIGLPLEGGIGGSTLPGSTGILVNGGASGSGKIAINYKKPAKSSAAGDVKSLAFPATLKQAALIGLKGTLILGSGPTAQEFFFTLDKRGKGKATSLPAVQLDVAKKRLTFKISNRGGLLDLVEALGGGFEKVTDRGPSVTLLLPATLRVGDSIYLAMTFQLKYQRVGSSGKGVTTP